MNTNDQSPFPRLPDRRFDIIYADPPWNYKGQLQHAGVGSGDTGGAEKHYPTITLDHLMNLPVMDIAAEDCLLFLWATNPHLDQAVDLGKAWGFCWATVAFVWDKQRTNPGYYTLSQCELCLVFKKGKIPRPRGARNVRQLVSVKRGKHSEKPDEVRTRIERMFPHQKKIELFARGGGLLRVGRMGAGVSWLVNILHQERNGRARREHEVLEPRMSLVLLWKCTLQRQGWTPNTNQETFKVFTVLARQRTDVPIRTAYIQSSLSEILKMGRAYTWKSSVKRHQETPTNVPANI